MPSASDYPTMRKYLGDEFFEETTAAIESVLVKVYLGTLVAPLIPSWIQQRLPWR